MKLKTMFKVFCLAGFAALMASCGGEEGTCQTSVDCAVNETCDVSTNLCVANQAETCTRPGTCGGGQICNVSTGECTFAGTCSATNPQPDACAYGQFCSSANCAEAPAATAACTNFANAGHSLTWGAGKTGPVIYSITARPTVTDTGFCGTGSPNRYRLDVLAYWGEGTFPGSDRSLETALHIVEPDGTEILSTNTVQNVTTTNAGKNVSFTVNLCRSSGSTYSAGLHFTDGNEVCLSVNGL